MNISIPLYIQHHDRYVIRPLFHSSPQRKHPSLERAIHLLTQDLREKLHDCSRGYRHDELAEWTFCPKYVFERINVQLELRKKTARCRFLFVTVRAMGRRLAFTPSLPELWFELTRGEKLAPRATEVLTEYFRKREREDEEHFKEPEQFALNGTAWISQLDMEIYPRTVIRDPEDELKAFLGSRETLDGERELFRVAHPLDQLYPDDLDRVILRDEEVNELTQLLRTKERRPVLLLGPPQVGKTALLHEYVYRTVAKRKRRHRVRNYVWHLSPQRLISGMMYVGQWENRLLAILREVERKNHLLYFDDFAGLYYAGKHSQSDLSVAHVLKPYVEQRKVRIIAEMTPEAFRVLRERDRGFADLFHVLRVKEPTEQENLHILISVQRQLESQYRSYFHLDVLPVVIDLQRRYQRHLSFPGKAASFLRRLAAKQERSEIRRPSVLMDFHQQSGLGLNFLDDNKRLKREDIIRQLRTRVIGQQEALEAAADVIVTAKARLNDPDRPLASFLFLGPTGVGKTETAKAIARFLFSNGEKLLRFDMNEFTEPGSATRLVGNFANPEGLLTTAIRRQPFSVLLLDEIEKADWEVFDLLLQVLGEGRLTDAKGRTADFTNTIIILTSNLGVREASSQMGFQNSESENRHIYEQAAEKFFRPEFFNRLDRIVPFSSLSKEEIQKIARLLIENLLKREGLLRRNCMLRVLPEALDQVADFGYDPILGARALKRELERQITAPVAARLASGLPEGVTVLDVYAGEKQLHVEVRAIERAGTIEQGPTTVDRSDHDSLLTKAKQSLRRMENTIAPLRPEGEITAKSLEGEHLHYFLAREQLEKVRQLLETIDEHREASQVTRHSFPSLPVGAVRGPRIIRRYDTGHAESVWRTLGTATNVQHYLEELVADLEPRGEELDDLLFQVLQELAHAQLLIDTCGKFEFDQVMVMTYSPIQPNLSLCVRRSTPLMEAFVKRMQLEAVDKPHAQMHRQSCSYSFVARGLGAVPIAKLEEGTHLVVAKDGRMFPVQQLVFPMEDSSTLKAKVNEIVEEHHSWQRAFQSGNATLEDDLFRWLPIVRIWQQEESNQRVIDLRTGMVDQGQPELGAFLKCALRLPEEFLNELG